MQQCPFRGGTGVTTEAAIGLKAYPVGSIYIAYNSTSPASRFGGTWTELKGVFPYFNSGTSTGGSNTHTLTTSQIPSHKHNADGKNASHEATGYGLTITGAFVNRVVVNTSGQLSNKDFIANTGGGGAHNNMPAYQTLYAWRRTA